MRNKILPSSQNSQTCTQVILYYFSTPKPGYPNWRSSLSWVPVKYTDKWPRMPSFRTHVSWTKGLHPSFNNKGTCRSFIALLAIHFSMIPLCLVCVWERERKSVFQGWWDGLLIIILLSLWNTVLGLLKEEKARRQWANCMRTRPSKVERGRW